jgi:hypothetical protein
MEPNEATAQMVDAADTIHSRFHPGFLETVDDVTRAGIPAQSRGDRGEITKNWQLMKSS